MDKQLNAEELAMYRDAMPYDGDVVLYKIGGDNVISVRRLLATIDQLRAERDAWELDAGLHEATVAARDVGIARLHRCCDHHKAECNNLAAIIRDKDAQLERALDALQDLFDEQNGPPLELPRHKASWQAAMAKARAELAKEVQDES